MQGSHGRMPFQYSRSVNQHCAQLCGPSHFRYSGKDQATRAYTQYAPPSSTSCRPTKKTSRFPSPHRPLRALLDRRGQIYRRDDTNLEGSYEQIPFLYSQRKPALLEAVRPLTLSLLEKRPDNSTASARCTTPLSTSSRFLEVPHRNARSHTSPQPIPRGRAVYRPRRIFGALFPMFRIQFEHLLLIPDFFVVVAAIVVVVIIVIFSCTMYDTSLGMAKSIVPDDTSTERSEFEPL